MQRGRYLHLAALAGALLFPAGMAYGDAGTPAASTLPAGWTAQDIGDIHKLPGSTAAVGTGASAVWTINGTGDDIWNAADSFHFAYSSLPGDGGVTARILTQTGGDASWAKTGTMLRESVDPGALDAYLPYTAGNKFEASWRTKAKTTPVDNGTGNTGRTLAGGPIWIRTQRQGKTYQNLISNDGKSWVLIGSQDLGIDPTKPVLAGLCATSHDAKKTVNATFDNVSVSADVVQPVASYTTPSPSSVAGVPGNGAVLLTFSPAPGGVGTNIYRQTQGGKDTAVLLNSNPTRNGWFIDTQALNGTAYLYTLKSVVNLSAAGIGTVESLPGGSQVVVQPQASTVGGLTLNYLGSVLPASVDLTAGVLTLKAQGSDIWDTTENGIFLAMPVSGDYSSSLEVLEQPAAIAPNKSNNVKVGPMIADAPSNYSQYAFVFATSGRTPNAVLYEGRTNVPAGKNFSEGGTKTADTKYPLWLKLTKKGSMISAFQSNDGTTYAPVGTAHDYGELPPVTYTGIGMSSADAKNFGSAKLDAASIQLGAP